MVRPGLAQTQAVLARELSGGTDEASRLFRQSVALTRQVERARIELARLEDLAKPTPEEAVRARTLAGALQVSQKEQLATQAALASFPRYRAVSSEVIPLADLQKQLRPGEAYYRMTNVGESIYAVLVTPTAAHAARARRHEQAARRAGGRAARHDLDRRERPAHDLRLRRRSVAPALHRAVRPVRNRSRRGQAPDLRAGRRDAAPARRTCW